VSSVYKQKIEKQFDSFCKKVIKNELRNIHRYNNYLLENEKAFSELTNKELNQLYTIDIYDVIDTKLFIEGEYIEISNELLFKAINKLPKLLQNILMLSYWFDMDDKDIANSLNLVRRTVNYMRLSSLKKLKKIIEDNK
jgi:RNA polymerase sigma factor (sigma-70 family)